MSLAGSAVTTVWTTITTIVISGIPLRERDLLQQKGETQRQGIWAELLYVKKGVEVMSPQKRREWRSESVILRLLPGPQPPSQHCRLFETLSK